ncbi:MAG: HypC/HybG/HupF family hydrogenase formation chaperone [Nitrosomonas sp.]|nr:MAG: HypC/HybG/HupF family hydrogenase formation chaperone [Nitrosomonas sp.]
MCLAIPVRVAQLISEDRAMVDLGGVRKEISLVLVEDVKPGDYVIVHVGFALQKLDQQEAERTLAMFAAVAGDISADMD